MKEFNVICAVALNGVIGSSATNQMPWHISTDLKYFKAQTRGKAVVMGSKTYASIGKPLKDRKNIVITRSFDLARKMLDVDRVDETYIDFESAFKCEHPGFFAIGGGRIYREAFEFAPTTLFITIVDLEPVGDVVFPIPGKNFLNDEVYYSNQQGVLTYKCVKRSGWMNDGGPAFQFTEFQLQNE